MYMYIHGGESAGSRRLQDVHILTEYILRMGTCTCPYVVLLCTSTSTYVRSTYLADKPHALFAWATRRPIADCALQDSRENILPCRDDVTYIGSSTSTFGAGENEVPAAQEKQSAVCNH